MTKQTPSPRPTTSASGPRSDETHNHRPMNGPAPPASTNSSKAHHGQSGADTKSGSMDNNTEATRGHATTNQPGVMNLTSVQAPPNTSATPTARPNSPSSTNPNTSPNPPTITISPARKADEPQASTPLLLCQKAYVPSRPHPTQNLIDLYGLTPLAQGVARKNLTTGEKINPMRKTYAGQIKGFQLAGKNKAFPHSEGGIGMSMSEMAAWPEPEWQNQKMSGRDLSKGLSAGVLGKLDKALKLEPGPVPKNAEWESILGLEKVKPGPLPMAESKSKHAGAHATHVPGSRMPNGGSKGAAEIDNRPKRTGKKRRYNDDSFEGYGEGFDDEDNDGGYSSGDTRRGGSAKKRKKEYASLNSPIGGGVGGYAAGLIGQSHVGRGIGAYGGR